MNNEQELKQLIFELDGQQELPEGQKEKWLLFRALLNIRPPGPLSESFIETQDQLLREKLQAKGITDFSQLRPFQPGLYLWQGDITTLAVDGIVNAANSGLTGCYQPLHHCLDNAIHTYAGAQLRNFCADIITQQNHLEAVGQAKITPAFNLPSRYIIHTVGPKISGTLKETDRQALANCYRSCLKRADDYRLSHLAFPCISTGEFRFPRQEAARIAVDIALTYLNNGGNCNLIFSLFHEDDANIYESILNCI